jgi:hypothetical protein
MKETIKKIQSFDDGGYVLFTERPKVKYHSFTVEPSSSYYGLKQSVLDEIYKIIIKYIKKGNVNPKKHGFGWGTSFFSTPQYTKTVYDQVKGEVMPILLDINSYEHVRGGKI